MRLPPYPPFLIRTCWLATAVLLGCSGGADGGRLAPKEGGLPRSDGGLPSDGPCADFSCGNGQRCEAVGSRAECVPDCDSVSCDTGERCDDSGATAICVAACDPPCGEGERCNQAGGEPVCEDATCAQLDCPLPTVCQPASDGKGGHLCVDATCGSDLDCEDGQYCYDDPTIGGYCVDDTCTPGSRRCSGDGSMVEECLSNGGGWFMRHACTSNSCAEEGGAHCPCDDDWQCPAHTTCEANRCEGTGVEPTCFLPVVPMENVLPATEFQWGSTSNPAQDDSSDAFADGRPFPRSTQVVTVPLVANLDDDNGDGRVNEQDYPEVLFLTYCGRQTTNHGLLRAVHAGGSDAAGNPLRGRDYFASTFKCNPYDDAGCSVEDPEDWLVWNEGDDVADANAEFGTGCQTGKQELDPTSTLAVGNLDGDEAGYPEIVAITEDSHVVIYDSTGHPIARSSETIAENKSGSPVIANLDGAGLPEIVVGRNAWTLAVKGGKLSFDKFFVGDTTASGNTGIGPIACVADLDGDGRQEIIAGAAALEFPDPESCSSPCTMKDRWIAAVPNEEGYCAVADVWGADYAKPPHPTTNPLDGKPEVVLVSAGTVYVLASEDGSIIGPKADWEAERSLSLPGKWGGPPNVDDFDGDGMPEIGTAASTGYVVLDLQAPRPIEDGLGCPAWPNPLPAEPLTGNFEDDRGPYATVDPASVGNPARVVPSRPNGQPIRCNRDADCNPGIDPPAFACNESTRECVCLHNGWQRRTQDDSSQRTGSSVFDFNGDGAAEVVYNDECFFRVYSGLDARLYSRIPSESRTRAEYPVVADLDNDGNAEIVFGASNESGFCRNTPREDRWNIGGIFGDWDENPYKDDYNAGLEVWGEPRDLWVSARRIWNQHAYHITNVTEGGAIPLQETPSWDPRLRTERGFNSYRSNPPSRAGIAPDLQVVEVNVGASGGGCAQLGNDIEITARIRNDGDLRVGSEVEVAFLGTWGNDTQPLTDGSDAPLRTTLGTVLRPRSEVLVSVHYDAEGKTPAGLPDSVTVIVDPDDLERECDGAQDDDNRRTVPVTAPAPSADLTVSFDEVDGVCPRNVAFTVENKGGTPASDVVVRFYAGNPDAGGTPVGMTTLAGPIAPGKSESGTADISLPALEVKLFAVVDPDDAIAECSEGNNGAAHDDVLSCTVTPI